MNKTAIKTFAVWARNKLIADIRYRAGLMGVTENGIAKPLPQSTGRTEFYDIGTAEPYAISGHQVGQRRQLVEAIRQKERDTDYKTAYQYIMEEVAYTWFNRLIAVRFMEVNDYLPAHIRVLSSETGKLEPDLVTTPFDADLPFTAQEEADLIQLKQEDKPDEVFRRLFHKQCNALHDILPGLFEVTGDYTELLLRVSYTDPEGVVWHLVHDIDEADFDVNRGGQVEIIGWLYQYYNTEPKDETFALLKKNVKVTKERIPSATQLFTPDWIVRYMVENSLGRLVISGQCVVISDEKERMQKEQEIADRFGWKYYLPEAEQTPEVRAQLTASHSSLTTDFQIEDLKIIDPCMGSGHILVYAFDVLMQIYESQGYTQRDAARSILQYNLYGLDIDRRAAQLAYFAVMMKARQYDRRLFSRGIQPHVYAIEESNGLSGQWVVGSNADHAASLTTNHYSLTTENQMQTLFDCMKDAKEYGSILTVPALDFDALRGVVGSGQWLVSSEAQLTLNAVALEAQRERVLALIDVAEVLAGRYQVVCTNPPYMGSSNMDAALSSFVKKYYPDSKSDLFAVFIERCGIMTVKNGYQAMITQHAWMFLSSFEKLRGKLLQKDTVNMAHLGPRAFEEIGGEVVQTTSFVLRNDHNADYKGTYCRLIEPTTQQGKEELFLAGEDRYTAQQSSFAKIPGSPVAYWVSETFFNAFDCIKIGEVSISDGQTKTGNNDKYLRLLWEVENRKIGKSCKWVLHAKGGPFRRWYGNVDTVIDWSEQARRHYREDHVARIAPEYIWFRKGICWTLISSSKLHGFRLLDDNSTFNLAAPSVFFEDEDIMYYILGYLNSKFSEEIISLLNPTLNTNISDITSQPLKIDANYKDTVIAIVKDNIELSKTDWDAFETSWDFQQHPLVVGSSQWVVDSDTNHYSLLTNHYTRWEKECADRFAQLKANEEELNRIFIDIYGLQDELTPDVEDKDVTVRLADKTRDVKSLLSYAVGCMFGRYSLDCDGLAYAGGEFSGQWVVVSGQYYLRSKVEYYVGQELSRAYRVAEVDGFGNGSLSAGQTAAEGGIVFTFGSNETGGSVNPFQYRRGTVKKLYEGICQLSVDCTGVEGGTGNPAYDLCSPEILDAISSGDCSEFVSRGWKDADRVDWETIHYSLTTNHFSPDADNVIPITDEEYLEDDIVSRLCEWLKVVYGEDTLEQNLDFIAGALGNKGKTSREVIRNYFLKDFFKDHCKTYQKRPIYWLFDSGRQNGFKALIYLHRYNADTIGNLRIDYLHRMQRVYESETGRMQDAIDHSDNAREVAQATKRREKLQKQLKECREYDEKISHLALARIELDLDDGVKVNYEKAQTGRDGKKYPVLAKI